MCFIYHFHVGQNSQSSVVIFFFLVFLPFSYIGVLGNASWFIIVFLKPILSFYLYTGLWLCILVLYVYFWLCMSYLYNNYDINCIRVTWWQPVLYRWNISLSLSGPQSTRTPSEACVVHSIFFTLGVGGVRRSTHEILYYFERQWRERGGTVGPCVFAIVYHTCRSSDRPI